RGYTSRCCNLGDACDLSGRISIGLLEFAAFAGTACPFSPVWTPRLRALACIFAGRLADILACVCRLPVSRDSFRNHRLFCNAVTGEQGPNIRENTAARALTAALPQVQNGWGRRPRLQAVCESGCAE